MKSWKAFSILCATVIAFSACGEMHSSGNQDGTADQEASPTGDKSSDTWSDPEVDSENLADEAETLLSLDTIDLALSKFNEALKLNPKNGRADVWASVIRSELELRGIVSRVRPLVESMPDGAHRYDRFVEGTNEQNDASLRHFYLTGPADIHTVDELQEWVDRVDMRLGELRDTLDRHKNEELRLLVPSNLFGGALGGSTDFSGRKKCDGRAWGPIKYQPSDCSSTNAEFLLNRADMEALSIGITGYQAYIALMNAWRISPDAIKDLLAHENDQGYDGFGAIVRQGAKLRAKNHMSLFDTGMRDFALSARYIIDHQKQACPRGRESRMNRPGYVFAFGLCANPQSMGTIYDRTMHLLDQLIARRPVTVWATQPNQPEIDVDLQKLASTPFADLNVLGPTSIAACGTEVVNMTPIKAYVSRGDLTSFLAATGYFCNLQVPGVAK